MKMGNSPAENSIQLPRTVILPPKKANQQKHGFNKNTAGKLSTYSYEIRDSTTKHGN